MKANPASLKSISISIRLFILFATILSLASQPIYALASSDAAGTNPGSYHLFLPAVQETRSGETPQQDPLTEDSFAAQVIDGEAGVVRGVYVQGVLALKVQQQPADNPSYVVSLPGWATQFDMAISYGVIGLLAHNNLSGQLYFNLKPGDQIAVIYGDGERAHYQVTEIDRFQALKPNSATSDFVSLDTGATLSAGKLFSQMYTGGDHVTFQTCIARDGSASWGRLFVIAQPIAE